MCMTSAHGTTNGSAYAIWWAMLCGTSTQTDRGCTRCPMFMRSLRSQPLSSALRLKNNTREQHECTNLMHSDLDRDGLRPLGTLEKLDGRDGRRGRHDIHKPFVQPWEPLELRFHHLHGIFREFHAGLIGRCDQFYDGTLALPRHRRRKPDHR